jgi:hypothetical protein
MAWRTVERKRSIVRNHRESRQFKFLDFFESSIERVVEGSLGRILPSKIQPAEIARRLERELIVQQVVGIDGPIAPNAFQVILNPVDAEQFEGYQDHFTSELADWVTALCEDRGLQTVGPITIQLNSDARVARRSIRISAAMIAGTSESAAPIDSPPESVTYSLEIGWHQGGSKRVELRDGFTIVGRAPASDIVIDDPSVSRFHARLEVSGRRLDIRDLDSTNGTRVNGRQTNTAPLEAGDHVHFGSVEARITGHSGK